MEDRLGIIDWGVGGVSIYRLIKAQLGGVPVTYFSDTGVTPYGKMSRPELVSRLDTVIEYLRSLGVTHVLIGCNAASTAIPLLGDHGIPVEGVIERGQRPLLQSINQPGWGSSADGELLYQASTGGRLPQRGIAVEQRIAQPLSGLIESGDTSSKKVRDEAKRILAPIKNCSHILLACTHYPAIIQVLVEHVSAKTKFIDPAGAVLTQRSHVGNSRALVTT